MINMQAALTRKIFLLVCDVMVVTIGYFFAYWLRLDLLDGGSLGEYTDTFFATLPWLLGLRVLCGILVKQHNWSFKQASMHEAFSIATGVAVGSVIFIALCKWGHITEMTPPRTVYFLEFSITLFGFGIIRFLPRYLGYLSNHGLLRFSACDDKKMKTIIFGAGYTGELLLRDIMNSDSYPYRVIGFVDDAPTKRNTRLHGMSVLGSLEDLPEIIDRYGVEKVLVSIAKLPAARLRHLVEICTGRHVKFKKIPSFNEIVKHGAKPVALLDVKLEDLLSREAVEFDHSVLASNFANKTVLVTGAAGSIGSEICRQIAELGAKKIVCLDINENNLYFLRLDLREIAPEAKIKIAFGSIRDKERVTQIMQKHKPQIVFHAAAHKHVPLMEDCPREAVANNTLGSINVAECARDVGAEKFVLISTDKAVRPTNIMGATKHMAEVAIRKLSHGSDTSFMAVRFGNVLGSAGSLIPILQRQIEKGGPLTITHPDITRYFMTIPEAVGLVLIASVQSEGATCVLDMGEPVKVDDIAKQLITLNGMTPDKDIAIKYIGLRPGEKMYEELFLEAEKLTRSSHPRIMVAHPNDTPVEYPELRKQLVEALASGSDDTAKEFLLQHVPEINLSN